MTSPPVKKTIWHSLPGGGAKKPYFWKWQVFREIKVSGFDASSYQTVQVFYPSKDGTKIPMFIVHNKVNLWFTYTRENVMLHKDLAVG